jgi:TPR repeat protein
MKYLHLNNQLSVRPTVRLMGLAIAGVVLSVLAMTIASAADRGQTDNSMLRKLVEFHTKMAKQGNLESIVKLGSMYERGEGVSKDRNKAIKLYKLAADQGYKPAQEMLANILANRPNNKRTYTIDTIRVPVQKHKRKTQAELQKQRELKLKLEHQKAANAAAHDELERLRQSQLEEQEKQRHLLDEVEKMQKAQQALAQERAKAEAARRELEKLRKMQEQALQKQKELADQQQNQPQQPQEQTQQKQETKKKSTFSSDPCKTPAAKFMSTCN